MKLQKQLVLPQARIKSVKIKLGASEHKVTLEIQTALTTEVAETFGCRELIYAGNVPRSGVKQMQLEGAELDCDIHLLHDSFGFQTVAEEIGNYIALLEGDGPKLVFQVKFSGYVTTVADLIEHVKVDPLNVTLKPAQMPLELREEQPAAEAEDEGERLISPEQAADTAPDNDGPSLAPAALVGGTHQKKRGRKPAPVAEPEPVDDDLGVPVVQ